MSVDTVKISARLDAERVRELESLARANERSLSGELRLAISRHLAQETAAHAEQESSR